MIKMKIIIKQNGDKTKNKNKNKIRMTIKIQQ